MLERLQDLDTRALLWLNSLGSETFDPLWIFITNQINWIPVFLIIAWLAFKRLGWRHALLVLFCIAILVTFTDQTSNFIKNHVHRLRPQNNSAIAAIVRAPQHRSSFSFFSGHATSSMAVAFFLYKVLHPYLKYMGFFFIWPLVFAYSRIYLGLHYPGDILMGYLWGLLSGWLMLKLYIVLCNKYFPQQKEQLDNPTNSEAVSNG